MFRFLLILPAFVLSSYGAINAVDSNSTVSVASYTEAFNQGFTRAIIRGFNSDCSVGGQIDPNFVTSYNNARAAKYTDIQAYWSLCNGATSVCMSYDDQLTQLWQTISNSDINISMLWIDMVLERDDDCNQDWDYSNSVNQLQAQALLTAIHGKYPWSFGVYANENDWKQIFGSDTFVFNDSLPLWLSSGSNNTDLTLLEPFGGWSTAAGQQYAEASSTQPFGYSVFSN